MNAASKRVLVAPLDWGLGHATRSIVVIRALINKGHDVEIASSGNALTLLRQEFPQLTFHQLPAYNVRYAARAGVFLPLLLQSVSIMDTIRAEQPVVEQLVASRGIAAIISDNRYGCWSRRVPSAMITHQLSPKIPAAAGFLQSVVARTINRLLDKFTACWIPDEHDHLLSGELSKSAGMTQRFIGILSRMHAMPVGRRAGILALLSGPEPQRTMFEKMIATQLRKSNEKFMIVRGMPGDLSGEDEHVRNHLPSAALNQAIADAALVICRSGYSSIMDLAVAGAKAHFVPTPGQTEQEYLAGYFERKGIAGFHRQRDFDLTNAIRMSEKYSGFTSISPSTHLLSKEIDILLGHE